MECEFFVHDFLVLVSEVKRELRENGWGHTRPGLILPPTTNFCFRNNFCSAYSYHNAPTAHRVSPPNRVRR